MLNVRSFREMICYSLSRNSRKHDLGINIFEIKIIRQFFFDRYSFEKYVETLWHNCTA